MKFCDETERTPIHADPCHAWVQEGWPWHGCTLTPDHDTHGGRGRHRTHECKCGFRWITHHTKR